MMRHMHIYFTLKGLWQDYKTIAPYLRIRVLSARCKTEHPRSNLGGARSDPRRPGSLETLLSHGPAWARICRFLLLPHRYTSHLGNQSAWLVTAATIAQLHLFSSRVWTRISTHTNPTHNTCPRQKSETGHYKQKQEIVGKTQRAKVGTSHMSNNKASRKNIPMGC